MILIIDNYDSFTYNLVQLFNSRGADVQVVLNDQISIKEIRALNPSGILLSPGPCTPSEAGICLDVVKELHADYPILGVCLGHQVIGEAFGATIINAGRILHGKLERIRHNGQGLFENVPMDFQATRYHSLIIDETTLSADLTIAASAKSDGKIMAIVHKTFPTHGLQFHPESYATENGQLMADNFIQLINKFKEENSCH